MSYVTVSDVHATLAVSIMPASRVVVCRLGPKFIY